MRLLISAGGTLLAVLVVMAMRPAPESDPA
jgi:hypothetical protein